MLKAATKVKNDADLKRVKQIAQETRVETLARLHASAEGLSTKQALINREEYGVNEIDNRHKESKAHFLLEAFVTPFTIILLILIAILLIKDIIPSQELNLGTIIIITVMILITGITSFVQNIKTSDTVDNLLKMVSVTSNVKRDGENQELPTKQIVVGDIVNLAAGDMVPADMRLLRSKDLFCTTSSIDGDYNPKEKIANKSPRFEGVNSYLNYPNILYEGTTIVSGSGEGVVFATGNHTLFGRVVNASNKRQIHKNTFHVGIKSMTHLLLAMTIIVSLLLLLINGLTKGDWSSAIVFSIAAAVGLTPELLPVIVTSNLVKGSKEMAKHGTIVKKLNSVQKFGSADILCTDKTGTLTQDQVVLERNYDLTMQETTRVLKLSYLNSYYQTGMKDLIDDAVINAAGDELDVSEIQRDYNKIDEIPFDYNRKRMSVVVANSDRNHGEHLLVTKGAAEEMLAVAKKVELNGKVLPLTSERKQIILEQIEDMNDDDLRVLLLGYKKNPAPVGEFSVADEKDLILVGFLTFLDPPKESARASLAKLQRDGLTVKILTGDNEAVTRALGLQVGLKVDTVYSAEDFEGKSDEEARKMVEESNIFVQMTPEVKTRIIRLLKENGHIVSYMGDKSNDAVAMREADVGIAFDNAVDIAKETASIILMHRDLSILENGIRAGRNTLGNIMKYFKIILSANFGNIISLIVSCLMLPFLPILPVQLIILNFIFGLSCLAIPYDKMPEKYLELPHTWSFKDLPKFMIFFGPLSSIADIITFAALYFVFCPQIAAGNQALFIMAFHTGWFIENLWVQEIAIHTLRDRKFAFFAQHATSVVLITTFAAGIIGTMISDSVLGQILHFVSLPSLYLLFILCIVIFYVLLTSLVKIIYLKREKFLI